MTARLVRWVAPGALTTRTLFETVLAPLDQRRGRRRTSSFDTAAHRRRTCPLAHRRVARARRSWSMSASRGSSSCAGSTAPSRFRSARSPDALDELPRDASARAGLPSRRAQSACGDAARRRRVHAGAQPRGRRGGVGGRRRSGHEALLTDSTAAMTARRAAHWNGTPTMKSRLHLPRLSSGARPRDCSRRPRSARICCRSTARHCAPIPPSPPPRRTGRRPRRRRRRRAPDCCPTSTHPASGSLYNYDATIKTDPRQDINRNFNQYTAIVSASQPLFRYQNLMLYDQAKQQVTQADYVLSFAQQDLIVRVAVAYFDILLAQFNIELAESQKKAVVRAARAGEAQFRGRRRDDHRYQRSPGEVRRDRRAGNHRAQRLRQSGDGAARDHRALSEGPEEAGRRARADAAGTQRRRLLGRSGAEGESQRPDRREQFRDREARGRSCPRRPLPDARSRRAAIRRRARTRRCPRASAAISGRA